MSDTSSTVTLKDRLWAGLIQQRVQNGTSVERWCKDSGFSVTSYYRHLSRLNRLQAQGIHVDPVMPTQPDCGQIPSASTDATPLEVTPSGFAKITPSAATVASVNKTTAAITMVESSTSPAPALRIHHGDDVIEVSNDAPPAILSMIREVLVHA
jgi:hypothetical protein